MWCKCMTKDKLNRKNRKFTHRPLHKADRQTLVPAHGVLSPGSHEEGHTVWPWCTREEDMFRRGQLPEAQRGREGPPRKQGLRGSVCGERTDKGGY